MQYAMLTTLIPEALEWEYRRITKHTMQDAANALQHNIYDGLCANLGRSIPVFNVLPVSSFPQYCTVPFIRSTPLGNGGKNLGFCNIKLVKNGSKSRAIYKALKDWCQSTQDDKTLFVYTISQPFLVAVNKLKKKFPQLQVCAIVADLPNMSNLSSQKSFLLKWFSAHRAKRSYALLPNINSFVLLTKHMADYMHLTQPYCVMEGIYTEQSKFDPPQYNADIKTVFYAGTLHRKFGVLNLIEAFKLIKSPNYRLVISGIGDSEKEIQEIAKQDDRICFHGQLPRKEVLKLQSSSTVLVNPRQNNEEFTKYSFPSKNLEYLSSGIPFIAYKLDGIPDEYDDYILYVKENNVSSLADKIVEVCEKTSEERQLIGTKSREFVAQVKNEIVQTKKIISLIREIN